MASKRRKNSIARAARKAERGKPGKGKGRYARKRLQQARGRFSFRSPFVAGADVPSSQEGA